MRSPRKLLPVALVLAMTTMARAQSGDPTGFTDALNAARADRGLPAVAYNPAAVPVAAANNAAQLVRGLGHHVTGGYGQVAVVGAWDVKAALDAWTGSPAHAALIYAPDLASIAYHQIGGVATASTQQSFAASPPTAGWSRPGWYYPVAYWRWGN